MNGEPRTRDPRDWHPADGTMDGGMTIQFEKVHQVKYYDDDTGHGLTYCDRRIGPGDVCDPGPNECETCTHFIAMEKVR